MAWRVTADPLRFDEAVDWFQQRVQLPDPAFRALSDSARRRAFWVAGAVQADVIESVFDVLDRAVDEGVLFPDFLEEVGEKLEREWAGSVADPGTRLETIYRTNIQGSYNSGRFQQQRDPDVVAARPYWMYDAILDDRTSEICEALDGTIREATDPWWDTRYSPNHWNCRASVRSLTRTQAERRGGLTREPTDVLPLEQFRASPSLDEWQPDTSQYHPEIRAALEAKAGMGL